MTLFDTYSQSMLALCLRYVKNEHDAEELVLNGFYKVFTTIKRFVYVDERSTRAWIKRIMVNECLMFLRKNKIAFAAEDQAADVKLDEQVFEKMNTDALLKLIDCLPDGYRIVFNMFVIEGYDHKEIAAILNITEGTSRSQLFRAKAALQKLLQENKTMYDVR